MFFTWFHSRHQKKGFCEWFGITTENNYCCNNEIQCKLCAYWFQY